MQRFRSNRIRPRSAQRRPAGLPALGWPTGLRAVVCLLFLFAPLTCDLHCLFLAASHAAASAPETPVGGLADDFMCIFGAQHHDSAPEEPHQPFPYRVPMAVLALSGVALLLPPRGRGVRVDADRPATTFLRPPLRPPIAPGA